MTDRIFRYTLPVDDRWHEFTIGQIHHVAYVSPNEVEFWADWSDEWVNVQPSYLRVVGTGQDITEIAWAHVGTCISPDRRLVWHVIEMFDEKS
jgi:hypothetical protein